MSEIERLQVLKEKVINVIKDEKLTDKVADLFDEANKDAQWWSLRPEEEVEYDLINRKIVEPHRK
jgi:hypothetical protein